jgi:hypothetical protein
MKKLMMIDHARRGNWAKVTDGKNIAYIQKGHFGGYEISTTHKRNMQTGTGFQYGKVETKKEALAMLEDAMRCFAPSWASPLDLESVKKYKDAEELLKEEGETWKDAKIVPFVFNF